TKYDHVATPYTSQALSGPDVTNIVLQDQCAFNLSSHVSMAIDPLVGRNVLNALDPANAVKASCFSW
ncbi:lipase, partial [Acinetobacter baumannii]